MAKTKVSCEECGNTFEVENKEINRGNGRFCSRSCSAKFGNDLRPPAQGRELLTYEERVKKYGLKFVIGSRLQKIKQKADKKNIKFNLTTEDVLEQWNKQGGKCFYTGRKMTWKPTAKHKIDSKTHMSIDRVVPSKGYVSSNIVLCTHAVNTFKNSMSIKDLKSMCKVIMENF